MVHDEMLKAEMREATSDMVKSIKYIKALIEMENPGKSDLLIDVLCEEIGKLRSPEPLQRRRPC